LGSKYGIESYLQIDAGEMRGYMDSYSGLMAINKSIIEQSIWGTLSL